MSKEDYAMLHYLLAKLKYELYMVLMSASNNDHIEEIKCNMRSVDEVMQLFIVEC